VLVSQRALWKYRDAHDGEHVANLQCALCFLFLAFVYLPFCHFTHCFSFLTPEIKVNKLRKKQMTRSAIVFAHKNARRIKRQEAKTRNRKQRAHCRLVFRTVSKEISQQRLNLVSGREKKSRRRGGRRVDAKCEARRAVTLSAR